MTIINEAYLSKERLNSYENFLFNFNLGLFVTIVILTIGMSFLIQRRNRIDSYYNSDCSTANIKGKFNIHNESDEYTNSDVSRKDDSVYHCSFVTAVPLAYKMLKLYLLVVKFTQIIYIEHYKEQFQLYAEFSVLLFSFCLATIPNQLVEFYMKYFIQLIIYITLAIMKINLDWVHFKLNVVSLIVNIFLIMLVLFHLFNTYSVFSLRLNREDIINEDNYQKDVLDKYCRRLPSNDIDLYRETNRILEMFKLVEIVEKIRVNRYKVFRMGLIVLFIISLMCLYFNVYFFKKNFDILSAGDMPIDKNDPGVINLLQENQKFDKEHLHSVLFISLPQIEITDEEDKKLLNLISEDNLYRFQEEKEWSNLNLVTYFTGTSRELAGINKSPEHTRLKVDSIFRKMKFKGMDSMCFIHHKNREGFRSIFPECDLFTIENDVDEIQISEITGLYNDETIFHTVKNRLKQSTRNKFTFVQFGEESENEARLYYLKELHDSLDDNTVLIITFNLIERGTSISKEPIVIINSKRNKGFFPTNNNKSGSVNAIDLASTLSLILNTDIPIHNQGKYMNEGTSLLQLSNQQMKEHRIRLLKQIQNLYLTLLKSIEVYHHANIQSEMEVLSVKFSNQYNDIYYNKQLNLFRSAFDTALNKITQSQSLKNIYLSFAFILITVNLGILIIQRTSFANLFEIFSSRNKNLISFVLSITACLSYISISYLVMFKIPDDYRFRLVIPFIFAMIITRIWFIIFFYFKNRSFLFSNVTNSILIEDGLAMIYLFRVYTVFINLLLSVVWFYFYSTMTYVWSNDKLSSLMVYSVTDRSNLNSLRILNDLLVLLLVYQAVSILYLYSYPNFSKSRQIYDSIFVLYDLKSSVNSKTCEQEAFESNFVRKFINYDPQSCSNNKAILLSFAHPNFSQKFYSTKLLQRILYTKLTIKEIEGDMLEGMENVKLESKLLARDNEINDFRRIMIA